MFTLIEFRWNGCGPANNKPTAIFHKPEGEIYENRLRYQPRAFPSVGNGHFKTLAGDETRAECDRVATGALTCLTELQNAAPNVRSGPGVAVPEPPLEPTAW